MKQPIPLYIAVEDELSEWVVRRVLSMRDVNYAIGAVYRKGGFGYLRKQVRAFNNAAKAMPFLLLTDLDQYACPPALIADWLALQKNDHLLLRVAVKEVESWLLGDAEGLAAYLRLRKKIVIAAPETLSDPKQELLRIAMKCSARELRDSIVWRDDKSGRLHQGPDYNGTLGRFVLKQWSIKKARQACGSLDRLFKALDRLEADFTCR